MYEGILYHFFPLSLSTRSRRNSNGNQSVFSPPHPGEYLLSRPITIKDFKPSVQRRDHIHAYEEIVLYTYGLFYLFSRPPNVTESSSSYSVYTVCACVHVQSVREKKSEKYNTCTRDVFINIFTIKVFTATLIIITTTTV